MGLGFGGLGFEVSDLGLEVLLLRVRASGGGIYLEGQGDSISRLVMGIARVTIWVIGVINLLTKSP